MNSGEAALSQHVDKKFQQIKYLEQGGITYLKFLLGEMFCMMNDIFAVLKSFLKGVF